MTDQQRAFINAYFENNFNASKAAEIAGYAHPRQQGYEVKNYPEVREEIDRRLKEQAASADEVLAVLGAQMRASIADCFEMQGRYPVFRPDKAFETGAVHQIKKLTKDKDGSVSVEMYDAHAAAVTIGRHLKLWTDKTEQSGSIELIERAAASLDGKFLPAASESGADGDPGEPDPGREGSPSS